MEKNETKFVQDQTPEDLELVCSNELGRFIILKDKLTKSFYLVAREILPFSEKEAVVFRKLEIIEPFFPMEEEGNLNPKD